MSRPIAHSTLDVRGQLCPMPVIKAAREMRRLEPGQVLEILGTDRGSIADLPAWAADTGNEFLAWHEDGDAFVFYIRRGRPPQDD
jgi:TusA-related sulfurtransferase